MTHDWEHKIRRSIFLSPDLETRLAKLASERETSTNDLICQILDGALQERERADAPTDREQEG